MKKTYLTCLQGHYTLPLRVENSVLLSPSHDYQLTHDGFKPGLLSVEVTQLPPLPEGYELSDCRPGAADLICALFPGRHEPRWFQPAVASISTHKPYAYATKAQEPFNPEPGSMWLNVRSGLAYSLVELPDNTFTLVRHHSPAHSSIIGFAVPADTPAGAFCGQEENFEPYNNKEKS